MKSKSAAPSLVSAKPLKPRRTQAERSATTRRRIIDAAIGSLAETGYSATTMKVIWERAGVSQGAMTHQFASKVDLMVAIVDDVFQQDMEYYARELAKFTSERDRAIGIIDLAWKAFSSPGGLAVLHIMMAVPGDKELKKRLPGEIGRVAAQADHIRRAGIAGSPEDRALLGAAVVLHRAALRGIVIELLSGTSPTKINAARKLLKDYTAHFFDTISPRLQMAEPVK